MPTPMPIIAMNCGANDGMLMNREARPTRKKPELRPIKAVTMGRPIATTEPKASRRMIEELLRLGARDAKRGAVFAGCERPEDGQRHENGDRADQHQRRMAVCEARPALEHEGGATQLSYISRLVETCLESRRLARSNSVSMQRTSSRVPRTPRPRPGLRAAASSRHLSPSRKRRRTAASGSVARSRHQCRRSGGPWRRS